MKLYELVNDLKRDEGFVPHAYSDSEGYLTIGYGIMVDERKGGGLTRAEGRYLLMNRARIAVKELDDNIHWWRALSPSAQRGLANMCYNLGWPELSKFKKMLAALQTGSTQAGSMQIAADEALDSKWAGQVGDRAIRIANLIRGV